MAASQLNMNELIKSQIVMKYFGDTTGGAGSFHNLILFTLYEHAVKNLPALTSWVAEQYRIWQRGGSFKDSLPTLPSLTAPSEIKAQITFERQSNESDKKSKPDMRTESVINFVCGLPQVKSLLYCGIDYVPDFNERICIADDVWFKLEDYHRSVGEARPATESIKFTLSTYDHDIRHLHQFIEQAQTAYEQQQKNKLGSYTYFFDQQTDKTRGAMQNPLPADFCIYSKNRFLTNRTFDNVFFEQHADVHHRVDFFMNRRDWYDKKGMPYTLGFMFHGHPGTGKTSTIKAIANVTKRHIFNIQLSQIRTNTALKHLFYSDEVHVFDGMKTEVLHIPVQQRLYVIEDIDAMKSVVTKRKPGVDASEVTAEVPETAEDKFHAHMKAMNAMDPSMFMGGAQRPPPAAKEKPTNAMDLATLLNVLDGTLEVPGRIIVITTNYPEKLDHALIRPGRIDMVIEFKKCSRQILKQMMYSFYDLVDTEMSELLRTSFEILSEREDLDYKWTPAEVNQILFRHFHAPEAAIKELIAEDPTQMFKFSHMDPSAATVETTAASAKASVPMTIPSENDVLAAMAEQFTASISGDGGVVFNKDAAGTATGLRQRRSG